ncbi:MAG: hypothetical protein KJP02_07510, partial [Octadecabacter sp.]|nr:hypothetical protein [Octadecabacter sp.]
FNLLMNGGDTTDKRLTAPVSVTADGWCEVRGGTRGLEAAQVDLAQWRAEEMGRFIRGGIPPLAVEVRMTGLDPDEMQGGIATNRPLLTVEATLRQVPDAGQVIVERAAMFNEEGDTLAVSGVFERLFLTSESMMQVSAGAATFKAGLVQMVLTGAHENPFGFGVDVDMRGSVEGQQRVAFDLISMLPDGVVSGAARAELTGFAGALPKPVGQLEVSVYSERGLGIMQVGMASFMAAGGGPDASELDILLDGVTVEADWSPATGGSD